MTAYFVAIDGEQQGPYTLEQVRVRCNSGKIQKTTLMWREGLSQWQAAEDVLRDSGIMFSDAAPPPSPPPPLSPQPAFAAVDMAAQPHDAGQPAAGGWRFEVPAVELPAGHGLDWIGQGWALFKAAPGQWIVVLLIWMGIQLACSLMPLIGGIASLLLNPVLAVGLLAFAHGIAGGEPADLGSLFIGFKDKLGELVILALIYAAMMIGAVVIGVILVVMLLGGTALLHAGNPEQAIEAALTGGGALAMLLVGLVMLALMALVFSAYWYAPGLVFFADQAPGAAMKHSFNATWRNWLPLLIFSLLSIVMGLVGLLPLGLGLLVVVPVLMAANYASFREMFGRQR
ncbi:MAG: BPSS1780 family membrane protein [Stenotrophobium sp.]